MYIVNQARRFFGYDTNEESEDDVVVDEVDVELGHGQSYIPYFSGYMDIDDIKRRLVNSKWPEKDKNEFIEYCEWSISELKNGGLDFQRDIADIDGDVGDKFGAALNHWKVNRLMSWSDGKSRQFREWCAIKRRSCRGLDPDAGYQPEEGRDIWSIMVQSSSYVLTPGFQALRVALGAFLYYGQAHGEWPPHPLNITDDPGNTTLPTAEPSYQQSVYAAVALAQSIFTFASMVSIVALHSPTQFREGLRGYAEINRNRLTALVCFKSSVDYMCKGADLYSIDSLRYRCGMESFAKGTSKSAVYDFKRMAISSAREALFYPLNIVLSGLSSITLAGGQTWGAPGAVLFWAGIAGFFQNSCDDGQGYMEARSARVKSRDIAETIDGLNLLYDKWIDNQDQPNFAVRCGINRAALTFQHRQQIIQRREFWFGIARMAKGLGGGALACVAIYYGWNQWLFGKKPPLDALACSLANTALSGAYFLVALKKMLLRNDEKMLKKELVRNSEFVRLNFSEPERVALMTGGMKRKFADRAHLFQKGEMGAKISRRISFSDNEFIVLDMMADFILEELRETGDPSNQNSELLDWLAESWGVLRSMTDAVLKSAADKAPNFERDQLKQGFASLMNIVLPLGIDKAEKRIRPSLVVLSKLKYFDAGDDDAGKPFEQIISDFGTGYRVWWGKNKGHLLRGLRSQEEFIASVLHIYERGTPPAELDENWIRFAKLVACAKSMKRTRRKILQAVLNAKLGDFPVQSGEGFDDFKKALRAYAETSIFNRAGQLRCLKELAKNTFMQNLLSPSEDENVPGANEIFLAGIKFLADRVDENQPLPAAMPSSPRSEYITVAPATTTTRIPQELREIQSSDSTTSTDDNDVDNRSRAKRPPAKSRQEQNSPAKKSGKGSALTPATSTSTQATSTSKKSSVRTDEDALVEDDDSETVLSILKSDLETSSLRDDPGEMHLWPRPWIEEV